MLIRLSACLPVLLSAHLWGQNTGIGSIEGFVHLAGKGTPVAGAHVYASPGRHMTIADDAGKFELQNLSPGTYRVEINQNMGAGPHQSKTVRVDAGQQVTTDFLLQPTAAISGRVLDHKGEPVANASVFLVVRDYQHSQLRYIYSSMTKSDDEGHYSIMNVDAGRAYILEASNSSPDLNSSAHDPVDIKLRKRTDIPTWYPEGDSPESGLVMSFAPGEHMQSVDIRLRESVSYCIDGVLLGPNGPAALTYSLRELEPESDIVGGSGFFATPPTASADAHGQFRTCRLHPGLYRLQTFPAFEMTGPSFLGETEIAIQDKDAHNVRVIARPKLDVPGEIAWDGKAPDQPFEGKIAVSLEPLGRAYFSSEINGTHQEVSVPGIFQFSSMLMGDYLVRLRHLPEGSYVKEVAYGGFSVLHSPLSVGARSGTGLHVVLARDGGTIQANVTDKDGNPVPDCNLVILPATAFTPADVADLLLLAQTDQYGAYTSNMLAPGKYLIWSTTGGIDHSEECIRSILSAKNLAKEIDLPISGAVQVKIQPISLQ